MVSKVILVLGAGPNIGISLVKHFAAKGYKTAGVSRTPTAELKGAADLALSADFSKPETIKPVFDEVKAKIGIPNVVVFNAAASAMNPDPFSISIEDFTKDVNINTISVFSALQQAIQGFKALPKDTPKTFIYTGNCLLHVAMPVLMDGGLGKRAGGFMVENAVLVHGGSGFRFYIADERKENGAPMYSEINGQSHADFYFELAENEKQGPWDATFVGGKYVDFEGKVGARA
ncbi:uncharacterized protein PAC_00868 [Phialocephala subalpina]|uniref:NAD(P)-binding protein n=1 Tax=Phialocephala subalpina TaxID=576137 RepID=A0A1L7WDX6_9HELO|nr:uncharacterized protein PAC_00868 [Phialocephala subalpina]